MGGLIKYLPYTYSVMVIGSLSLMGFPFLTGFYSKDLILEVAYAQYSCSGTFAHWLGTLSAFLTAFYSFRLIYLSFIGNTNAFKGSFFHVHEGPLVMSIPLGILALGSIFVGYIGKDAFVGLGTTFWNNALTYYPSRVTILESEFMPTSIKLIPVIFSIIGATLAILSYHFFPFLLYSLKTSSYIRPIFFFLSNKWYWEVLYNKLIVRPFLHFGHIISYKLLDRGLFEILGPSGLSRGIILLARSFSLLQSGYIFHYAFVLFSATTLSILLITSFSFLSLNVKLPFILPIMAIFILGLPLNNDNLSSLSLNTNKFHVVSQPLLSQKDKNTHGSPKVRNNIGVGIVPKRHFSNTPSKLGPKPIGKSGVFLATLGAAVGLVHDLVEKEKVRIITGAQVKIAESQERISREMEQNKVIEQSTEVGIPTPWGNIGYKQTSQTTPETQRANIEKKQEMNVQQELQCMDNISQAKLEDIEKVEDYFNNPDSFIFFQDSDYWLEKTLKGSFDYPINLNFSSNEVANFSDAQSIDSSSTDSQSIDPSLTESLDGSKIINTDQCVDTLSYTENLSNNLTIDIQPYLAYLENWSTSSTKIIIQFLNDWLSLSSDDSSFNTLILIFICLMTLNSWILLWIIVIQDQIKIPLREFFNNNPQYIQNKYINKFVNTWLNYKFGWKTITIIGLYSIGMMHYYYYEIFSLFKILYHLWKLK